MIFFSRKLKILATVKHQNINLGFSKTTLSKIGATNGGSFNFLTFLFFDGLILGKESHVLPGLELIYKYKQKTQLNYTVMY